MNYFRQQFLLGLTALIFSASASTSAANTVYQVEMIVFERGNRGAEVENPAKNIRLEYAAPWQRLINPHEESVSQNTETGSTSPSDEFLQAVARERAQNTPSADGNSGVASTVYYEYLPAGRRELGRAKESLDRNNQFRVLFHEAWVQPMTSPEKSSALILHGGNKYGEHYELQGYINLGINRVLHLDTNLWFSQFTPDRGQGSDHWFPLPLEPQARSGKTKPGSGTIGEDETDPRWNGEAAMQPNTSNYLVSQIATLQQRRKMRSGELHYIDHPKLGILIKVTLIQG